jgi:autophagy-related protein 5
LHIGLKQAVLRLHKFAPPTISFTRRVVEEPEPGSSHDDEDENGEQQDSRDDKPHQQQPQTEEIYPVCWFEDEATELPLRWQLFAGILWDSHQKSSGDGLPWKIRLHFTNYPSSQLLELDSSTGGGLLTTVERIFKNSLKQALVLQHGHAKVTLNMTKQSHQRMWDSIVTSKYSIYKPLQEDIQAKEANHLIPIRLLVDSSKPLIQKRCDDQSLTLGQLLHQWIPQHFEKANNDEIQPKLPTVSWRVSGIVPPLSTPIVDLWQTLCHPDTFLYISIVMQQ